MFVNIIPNISRLTLTFSASQQADISLWLFLGDGITT